MNLSAKSSVTGLWIVGGGTNITLHAWQTPESDTTVTVAGQLITGAVVSCTVTIWSHVPLLPNASVAVQVTVVLPRGKHEGALLVIEVIAAHASETVGVALTTITPMASLGSLPNPIATQENCKLPDWVR